MSGYIEELMSKQPTERIERMAKMMAASVWLREHQQKTQNEAKLLAAKLAKQKSSLDFIYNAISEYITRGHDPNPLTQADGVRLNLILADYEKSLEEWRLEE